MRNGFYVYRQTYSARYLNQEKQLLAVFRSSSDADFFAHYGSETETSSEIVYWTVETKNEYISKYQSVPETALAQ
jgi:hypothetical protein